MRLDEIIAPHRPDDGKKLAALRRVYAAHAADESRSLPPPVVVLTDGPDGHAFAITGSHRIAAMEAEYRGDLDEDDLSDEVVTVDWDDAYEALRVAGNNEALEVLDAANIDGLSSEGRDVHDVTHALTLLPAAVLHELNPRLYEGLIGDGAFK